MAPDYDAIFLSSWLGTSLNPSGLTTGGGAEAQVLMLARGLSERGYRVGIATWAPREGMPANPGGVELVAFPRLERQSPIPGLSYLLYAGRFVRALSRIRARNYVQRGASPDTFLVALTARLRRARFIYSAAGLVDFDFRAYSPARTLFWLYRLGYRLADAVVVQTAEQRRLSRERLGRDSTLIASIAEPQPASAHTEGGAFLWIGRLADYKRPHAYVELARALPDARFWMIAAQPEVDPEASAALQRASADVPNLELLATRSREEILQLISRAVAVVNTSVSEGMPNVFLEAWSQGIPTLTLSHDPGGVIARHGLGAVADGSSEGLAALAADLWHSPADRKAIGERCREYVANEHDYQRVVDQWVTVLGLSRTSRDDRT